VELFRSLRYKIMSSANRDSLTASFPICISFIFFFLPYCSACNSKTMLNSHGEEGKCCLIPDFRVNTFSFSPSSVMLAVFVIYTLYNVEVYSLYS
jgi:hypothetical protein